MAKTRISAAKYLAYCHGSDEQFIKLLSRDFEDHGRYSRSENPVATTWLISFEHIAGANQTAPSFFALYPTWVTGDILRVLLPRHADSQQAEELDDIEADEAISTLEGYAFVTMRGETRFDDVHRLVQLAMRNTGSSGSIKQRILLTWSSRQTWHSIASPLLTKISMCDQCACTPW